MDRRRQDRTCRAAGEPAARLAWPAAFFPLPTRLPESSFPFPGFPDGIREMFFGGDGSWKDALSTPAVSRAGCGGATAARSRGFAAWNVARANTLSSGRIVKLGSGGGSSDPARPQDGGAATTTGVSSNAPPSFGAASDALSDTEAGPPPRIEYRGGVSDHAETCAKGINTAPWHIRLIR